MNVTEGKVFLNTSGNSAQFTLRGGRYVLSATGTVSGTLSLQMLAADGATWVAPMTLAGTANGLTAAGSQTMDLPAGQYRLNCGAWTAVYASIASIPA